MIVVSGRNYVNKPQYRTQNLKNELWGPKNVNKLGSFGNTGKGLRQVALFILTNFKMKLPPAAASSSNKLLSFSIIILFLRDILISSSAISSCSSWFCSNV